MEIIQRVCIDTCSYSAFKRGNKKLITLLESAEQIFAPAIVLGELYAAFSMGKYKEKNLEEFSTFLDMPGIFIVDTGQAVARRYGQIVADLKKQGTPIPTNDIWIAAACFESASLLLTSDRHFDHVPGLITLGF